MTLDEIATEWACQSMEQIAAWDGKGKSPLHPCRELAQECMRATTMTQDKRKEKINLTDLVGQKFGKLTVIECVGTDYRHNRKWLCKCDCGKTRVATSAKLKAGIIVSCGCLYRKKTARVSNPLLATPSYKTWRRILNRCENPNGTSYHNYGGRGIKVCDEWHDFNKFNEWFISSHYFQGLSIDRIDVNGNYEPSNCRWATAEMQNNNKRINTYFEFEGKKMTLPQICRKTGIEYKKLYYPIKQFHITLDEAIRRATLTHETV
jgi:hypothetical protein